MKCNFCNYDNPEGATKCVKCGQPIQAEAISSREHDRPTARKSANRVADNLKKTINENDFKRMREQENTNKQGSKELCPECHLELEDGICPSCGYHAPNVKDCSMQAENKPHVNKNKETMRYDPKADIAKGSFTLTPLSGKTRIPEGNPIKFAGNEIELNRGNTAPENATITSKTQAIVTLEDGKWFITDGSELRSTFVQASRKIELKKDDIILIGNQLYRFDVTNE